MQWLSVNLISCHVVAMCQLDYIKMVEKRVFSQKILGLIPSVHVIWKMVSILC